MSFAHFFYWNFGIFPSIFKSSLNIRLISSVCVLYAANISSYFCHLPFDFAYNSFQLTKSWFLLCFYFK